MQHEAARSETGDEAALINRALLRDPAAVAEITTRYNRRLFRIARSILRSDDEAEDVLQSAYLKAFSCLAEFRQECSLGTWLTRIVMNEALGQARRRKRELPYNDRSAVVRGGDILSFPDGNRVVDPERALAQRQIQAILEEAIDELPDLFRTVLVARILEEMSVEETATLLGLRTETVKTRLHRARRLLREALERRTGPVLVNAFPFDGWRCERMTQAVLHGLGMNRSTSGNRSPGVASNLLESHDARQEMINQ
jgi:RNA polymerase sigma-70 factor, ECF subfamily